ncbi:hypothetical protein SL1157_3161 [Ruegeria lacuscaerulensis ITI-1157]|nr:hypothetical protein SL1157_3161 [Ruegeria lacuscaerulensis ITI-1157]
MADRLPLSRDLHHRTGREDRAMIALLFALLAAVMALNYFGRPRIGTAVFFFTLALSVYWLKYHATSQLSIQL